MLSSPPLHPLQHFQTFTQLEKKNFQENTVMFTACFERPL